MARQQAAQRPIERNRGNGVARQQSSTLIEFDPQLAVRAIVFHLIDEGITSQVDAASINATISRLQRKTGGPTIEQWMWAEMTHAHRLQWLLEKTQTAARLVSDELSVLESSAT